MFGSKNWEKAIEIANKEMLSKFCYKDGGKTYFVYWTKYFAWSEPVEIKVFEDLINKL